MLRFAEFINAEYADKGVLAYSIHPGSVESDMASTLLQKFKHMLIDTPELAAHTLLWLVKERRDWLAGRYISCVWDMEEFLSKKDEVIEGDKLKVKMVI